MGILTRKSRPKRNDLNKQLIYLLKAVNCRTNTKTFIGGNKWKIRVVLVGLFVVTHFRVNSQYFDKSVFSWGG